MSKGLTVYVVSMTDENGVRGGCWEDLEKALSFYQECVAELDDQNGIREDYYDLMEEIILGNWQGQSTLLVFGDPDTGMAITVSGYKTTLRLG